MIVVTGTKRSGTSMWMQLLIAAGFPRIGEAFPGKWANSIKAANPRGFYESIFRQGVYYATNPDPRTGAFLQPKATRDHVVKVFIPGLIRSDMAYLDRVLATLRDWREYTLSLRRLYELEEQFTRTRALAPHETEADRTAHLHKLQERRGALPPAVEWWFENYELIRDVAVRRYPFYLATYQRLLNDPAGEIAKALRWIGKGNVAAAAAAVERELRTQTAAVVEASGVDSDAIAIFDEMYDTVDRNRALPADLVARMNALHTRLEAQWKGRPRRDDELPAET